MVKYLESISEKKLYMLTAEVMARDGYIVNTDPISYPEIDILCTPIKKDLDTYYIVVLGRRTKEYITKKDMKRQLPTELSIRNDDSKILIVTNCRSSSKKAREVAKRHNTSKKIWYVSNLLNKIRSVRSEYLIEIYEKDLHRYQTKSDLDKRMNHQGISLNDEDLDYISNYTYYPRKIIAYIELKNIGQEHIVNKLPSIKNYISQCQSPHE